MRVRLRCKVQISCPADFFRMANNEELELESSNEPTGAEQSWFEKFTIQEQAADQAASLIPGLTDEIAIVHVLAKLPWKMLWNLSVVSRSWRRVLGDRQVFDARRRSKCITQTFVAVSHLHPAYQLESASMSCEEYLLPGGEPERSIPEEYAISLYDPLENNWNLLPDFTYGTKQRSLPYECACVVLSGKLYIIGGEDKDRKAKAEMYMIDLGDSRRVWQQCASMRRPRSKFSCETMNTKIYAFGGSSRPTYRYLRECEVYDPTENVWRPIASMVHHQIYHSVVSLGKDLYVYAGVTVHQSRMDNDHEEVVRDVFASFGQVYSPEADEWKKIIKFERSCLVAVDEQLYMLEDGLRISVYDVPSNSWTRLEKGYVSRDLEVYAAVAVGEEILTLVTSDSSGLLLSKGFNGRDSRAICTWRAISCPHSLGSDLQLLHGFQL